MFLGVIIEFLARGADLLPVQADIHAVRQHADLRLRVQLFQTQQLVEYRLFQFFFRGVCLFGQYGVKPL